MFTLILQLMIALILLFVMFRDAVIDDDLDSAVDNNNLDTVVEDDLENVDRTPCVSCAGHTGKHNKSESCSLD